MEDGLNHNAHIASFKSKPAKVDKEGVETEPAKLVVTFELPLSEDLAARIASLYSNGEAVKLKDIQRRLAGVQ